MCQRHRGNRGPRAPSQRTLHHEVDHEKVDGVACKRGGDVVEMIAAYPRPLDERCQALIGLHTAHIEGTAPLERAEGESLSLDALALDLVPEEAASMTACRQCLRDPDGRTNVAPAIPGYKTDIGHINALQGCPTPSA